jgi:hypothetical protein
MSYLDVPRLHFAGRFKADPSTIDNVLDNFNPAVPLTDANVLWNPFGEHVFRISDGAVFGAVDPSGKPRRSASDDPVIGAVVASTDAPYPAKLVDLDPDQQMLSQVFGLKIRVALPEGAGSVVATMPPTSFADLWVRVDKSKGGIRSFSAIYQAVLEDVQWTNPAASPVLQQLQARSPDRLALKLIVDGYEPRENQPAFTTGRMVGTIGPAAPSDPVHFVAGRRLASVSGDFGSGLGQLDLARRCLVLDLGNAIRTSAPGGTLVANRFLVAIAQTPVSVVRAKAGISPAPTAVSPGSIPIGFIPLGEVAVHSDDYQSSTGLVELPLTGDQLDLVAQHPLTLFDLTGTGPPQSVLQEHPAGLYVDADMPFLRMNPGEEQMVNLYAVRFSRPAANLGLELKLITSDPDQTHNNTPADALRFPPQVVTDMAGRAPVRFSASAPVGKPAKRQYIDGQVYYVGGDWQAFGSVAQPQGGGAISVLVFDEFPVIAHPSWPEVEPILAYYARMYPSMRKILDLSKYEDVRNNRDRLAAVLSLSPMQPHYMPVLRDLSANKRTTLLNWLNDGAPQGPADAGVIA